MAHGRVMRAPDHGADGGDAGGDDAGSDDAGGDGGDTGTGTCTGTGSGGDDAGDDGDDGDEGAGKSFLTDGDGDADDKDDADDKGGDDTDADDKGGDKDDKPELFGAPDGDYEVNLAEDLGIEDVDKAALDAVTPLAKELNLSQAGFDRLVDVYARDVLPGVMQQVVDGVNGDVAAQRQDWRTETETLIKGGKDADGNAIKADEAFDGRPVKEVRQIAAKGIDRFFGSEFRKFLETSGLGDNPAMTRGMYLVGKAISEDMTFPTGGTESGSDKLTREQKYYGKK